MAATIVGGVIAIVAAAIGAILGAFLPRWAAKVGRLRCNATVSNSVAMGANGTIEENPSLPVNLEAVGSVADVTFWINVDIFNEKDTPTGLRDLSVVFRGEDGTSIQQPVYKKVVHYSGEEARQHNRPPEQVSVVNLAPGEWMHLELMSGFEPEVLEKERERIERCSYAEFQGKYPNGRIFRARIEFPNA